MDKQLSIRARLAGLQIPISQIQTPALALSRTADDMIGIESQEGREALGHIQNFADLIVGASQRLSGEAEGIECDAPQDRLTAEGR